jgi:hypothetical protein
MIEESYGDYKLVCDVCGWEADELFNYFDEAVQYKRDEGWKSQRHNGEWEDVCPDCQE